ncbi:MAG: fasciclin domain-containing protein [Pseudomonadota bacterium]
MKNVIRSAAFGAAFAASVFASTAALAENDVVDAAVATPELSTLVTAVTEAGLVDTLKSEGPFTVFAPVNDAFAGLPEGALDGLLADKDALTGVLTYHVVPAEVMAADLIGLIEGEGGKYTVTTVAGGTIDAAVVDGSVVLTDANGNNATVVIADVDVSNGVVHVIDGVLLP